MNYWLVDGCLDQILNIFSGWIWYFEQNINFFLPISAEGAFKKLKPEPNSGLSSVSGSVSSPGSGISSLPQHAGHTPTTVSCPTPARRRHRTTFTQVKLKSASLLRFHRDNILCTRTTRFMTSLRVPTFDKPWKSINFDVICLSIITVGATRENKNRIEKKLNSNLTEFFGDLTIHGTSHVHPLSHKYLIIAF